MKYFAVISALLIIFSVVEAKQKDDIYKNMKAELWDIIKEFLLDIPENLIRTMNGLFQKSDIDRLT